MAKVGDITTTGRTRLTDATRGQFWEHKRTHEVVFITQTWSWDRNTEVCYRNVFMPQRWAQKMLETEFPLCFTKIEDKQLIKDELLPALLSNTSDYNKRKAYLRCKALGLTKEEHGLFMLQAIDED